MSGGARIWYFPDGYLPEKLDNGGMEAHEALMILNTGNEPVDVRLDIYFEDAEPVKDIAVTVGAERVKTLRMDNPADLGGLALPVVTQYALRLRSSRPVVVQFGRLDTTQESMAYYCGIGYSE